MYDPAALTPGTILLLPPTPGEPLWDWVLDKGIQWSTQSPFCHAALVTQGGLLEALTTVRPSPLTKYAATGWAYTVAATPDQRAAATAWMQRQVGRAYGYRELWADFRRYDLHTTPRALPLRHWTCSGIIAVAYATAGVRLTYAPYPAPADLAASPLLLGPRPRS